MVLAGNSVVWSRLQPEAGRLSIESADVIYRVVPGGPVQEVLRIPAPRRGRLSFGPVLAASDRLLAVGAGEDEYAPDGASDPVWSEIRAGPPAGPLSVVVPRDVAVDRYGFDVSGDALATLERQAPGSSTCVVRVRELTSGRSVTVGQQRACPSPTGPTVRVAGTWLARLSADDRRSRVEVFNWETGETAYRLAVPRPADDVALELQDDGTVAIGERSRVSGTPGNVSWASVSEPQLHRIAAPRRISDVRLAAGQIAYVRRRVPSETSPRDASEDVVVQPLRGQPRVVSFTVASAGDFDFDGSRIALFAGQCLYIGDVSAGPAPTGPPLGTCPAVAITLSPIRGSFPRAGVAWNPATGMLTTRVFCELAGPEGCVGTLLVTGTSGRTGRPLAVAAGSFAAPRFGVSHTRLQLASRVLAALRTTARHRVRVTVTAVARDASGRRVSTRRSVLLPAP